MPTLAILNNVEHQDVRIITTRSANFGDNVMFVPTFPAEFRSVQACYPILFHRNSSGETYPVALFGFERNENLFLDDAGWHAPYVPAMIRRQPFLIGFQQSKDGSVTDPVRVLSLDMDHPRVSTREGQALFQPLGGRTPYLEETAVLLEDIHAGHAHSKNFVETLQQQGLLEAVTLDIMLADGSRNQLLGFNTIDEDKVRQLPGATLEEFSRQGFLLPVFMVLASTLNVRKLIDLKNARLKG